MNPRIQVAAIILTILISAIVLELVRKRKLREEYSLLWISAIVCLGILAAYRPIVGKIAELLGIAYAPSALFIAAFGLGFALILHFSIAISRILEHNKRLTQEIGLLKLRMQELEAGTKADKEGTR